jgi:hypothetical protein
VAEVDDVEDRFDWRDEDTSYDEGETPRQTPVQTTGVEGAGLGTNKKDQYYESHELRSGGSPAQGKKKKNSSEDENDSN